jgi:uncharacterized coiled-coil protein SlyX
MVHLAPPSVQAEQGTLTDYQATQRAWFELARGSLAQADVLQRFERMSYHYAQLYQAHEGCGSSVDRIRELETGLSEQRCSIEVLTKANQELRQQVQDYASREEGLSNQLSTVEAERDGLLGKNGEQAGRIKALENVLSVKTTALETAEAKAAELSRTVERQTVESSQAEILRHNYVRQLVPLVVKRLQESDEYQMAWGDVFNAAIDAGWLEGVKVGRETEQIEEIVNSSFGFDMSGALNFRTAYDAMFSKQFSYVEKIVASHRLPLADLMNIFPEGAGVTPGVGSSGVVGNDQEQEH